MCADVADTVLLCVCAVVSGWFQDGAAGETFNHI